MQLHLRLAAIFGILCGLGHRPAEAQTTITRLDVEAVFGVERITVIQSAPRDSITIGNASSAPQFWDFSTLAWSTLDTMPKVDPRLSAGASTFPDATTGVGDKNNLTYYTVSDSGLFTPGSFGSGFATINTPPSRLVALPLAPGSAWTSLAIGRYTSGADTLRVDGIVDAYGRVKTIDGTFDCLRLKTWHTTWRSDGTRSVQYFFLFLANGGRLVEIDPPDSLAALSGTFKPTHVEYTHSVDAASGVASRARPSLRVALETHPNPLRYGEGAEVRIDAPPGAALTLVNMLGIVVQRPALRASVEWQYTAHLDGSMLPTGTYLLRLTAGSSVTTQVVTVMR